MQRPRIAEHIVTKAVFHTLNYQRRRSGGGTVVKINHLYVLYFKKIRTSEIVFGSSIKFNVSTINYTLSSTDLTSRSLECSARTGLTPSSRNDSTCSALRPVSSDGFVSSFRRFM